MYGNQMMLKLLMLLNPLLTKVLLITPINAPVAPTEPMPQPSPTKQPGEVSSSKNLPASPDNSTPPFPTSGLFTKIKQVDEVARIRDFLTKGSKNKLDPDGFQTVEYKSSKRKKKGVTISPKCSPAN